MRHRFRHLLVAALVLPIVAACSAPAAPQQQPREQPSQAAAPVADVPQRPIVIAFGNEPATLESSLGRGSGNRDIAALFSGFLAYLTPEQQAVPYLAAELPSMDKGTWVLRPDGHVETTYRLKREARWHDGTPVTAGDWVFAHMVHLDPELPTTKVDVDRRIASVRAVDDHTLLIDWKEPYIWAGSVFEPNFPALPRHLLEDLYANDKETFINGPHWNREFVGSGPYKLERWEQGVEMALRAHDGFALGKPRVDSIILRVIPDGNTVVASLLSGAVDAAFHSSITLGHNQALEQAGFQGTVEYWRGSPHYLEFQQRDWGNLQRAVLDVRVRRALLHAVDRKLIVENLYFGKAQVHHFWLAVDDPAFPAADRAVSKYDYDPERAAALLREAGWNRGPDGLARNAAGEPLQMFLVSQGEENDPLQAAVVADNWKAVGAPTDVHVLTRGQERDREFRTKFAGANFNNRPLGYDTMVFTADQTTMPENRWQGNNYSGYSSPVLEELWPRVMVTLDLKEREGILVEALKAMTADAVITPTHLQTRAMAYRAGLSGPKQPWVGESALIWNSWEWQWK